MKEINPLIILILILPFTSSVSQKSKHWQDRSPYPRSFSGSEHNKGSGDKLYKNVIGDNRRIYACSGKDFFSFESNGSVAWTVHLNYTCNADIAPVHGGGSRKIYVVAENRVLKIYPLKIGTSEAPVEVFFDAGLGEEKPGEIVGISASIYSSVVIVNVKKRGLFAYKLQGNLLWSAGPIISQNGYQQGCRKNTTECYFTSPPVIDHCEASILISNTVGELYSVSVRRPYFKWIKDLSSYGISFVVTPGNNGQLFVSVPDSYRVLALDASTGTVLWERSIGPLSSSDYEPVVDANGWISFGSLDGCVYSFSPTGSLRKLSNSVSSTSVIQVNPILDCSGYGVYISQTEMEEKSSQRVAGYHHVYASKPKNVMFTHLVPASGAIHSTETDPGNKLLKLSESDLQHFTVDERTLLAFFTASRNDNSFPCRSTSLKLASSCSKLKPKKSISLYRVDEKIIMLVLIIESILLVLLVAAVQYCCIFWRKKKLQGLGLVKFLEKRRSLKSQERALGRKISKLEEHTSTSAAGDNEEVVEKLSDLVKERECIRRKLSSRYSLGRDGVPSSVMQSSSFRGSKNESLTIFHSLGETTSSSSDEIRVDKGKGKGKAEMSEEDEEMSSSSSAYPFSCYSISDVEA